jgi:peptidoglycan hydrolase-like protein with peptidoglycan-binding domain
MNKFTKFVVGTVAALALTLVVSASASASSYMQNGTLKYGSNGSQVMSLQQTLNMTLCKVAVSGAGSAGMETIHFGPATKAAVKCFQAANGLTSDGIVGPMTGAKLSAVTTTVNTGLPAGCASSTGYSTVSGAPCSGTPATTVFPAGCVSSVGYSSTTGVSCATGAPSTGVVANGPFSFNSVSPLSGYANTQVGVGAQDKVIGDLRIVSGAGGSANLTGVNVNFFNKGNGDFMFTKYASSVSVWLNGVKVGTLAATSFTQYNSQFSAFIPTSGAVLNPSTTNDLSLSVTALPVIDSANLGYNTSSYAGNAFAFDLNTIRYTDTTGSFS